MIIQNNMVGKWRSFKKHNWKAVKEMKRHKLHGKKNVSYTSDSKEKLIWQL